MMSAKSASASSASSSSRRSGLSLRSVIALLHPGADEALARDRERVARKPVDGSVPEVERGREVLDAARREEERRRPADPQHEPREKARVVREEAARLRGDVAALVAEAEGRSLEDREHQPTLAAHDPAAARLREGLDHHLVDVHVQRPREREEDAVGDVVRRERLDALVRRLRRLLVALEADERELGLRQPRVDGRDADRAPEEILAQPVDEAAQRELRGDVHGGVLRTPAGPRSSP